MLNTEYDSKKQEIITEFNEKMKSLNRDYVDTYLERYHFGDIIQRKDGYIKIKVEKIVVVYSGSNMDYPEPMYKGTLLTKSGKPFKSGELGIIYHSDSVKVESH